MHRRSFAKAIAALPLLPAVARAQIGGTRSIVVSGVSSFRYVEALLPAFTAKTGIAVQLQTLPYPQLRQNSMADLVGGTANSDVYTQDIIWLGEWASRGFARPLDDLVARDAAEIDFDDFLPGAVEANSRWDGKLWSLPFGAYYFLNFYRSDLFGEAGIAPPVTLDDITTAAAKLTNRAANRAGIAMPYQRGGPITSWFLATYAGAGGKLLVDPPKDFSPTLNTPLARQVLDSYLGWLSSAPPGAINYHWNDQTVAMQNGRIAMAPSFSINGTEFVKPDRSAVAGKIGFTSMPRATASSPPRVPFGGWALAINPKTAKTEEAWTFLKYMTSSAVQVELAKLNGTPVRRSAMENAELQATYPWLSFILEAERQGQVVPDYRPRYPFYPELEEALGLELNRAALKQIPAGEALSLAQEKLVTIIKAAGYPIRA
jgi:multiple sugar transport system substrate-binding protein